MDEETDTGDHRQHGHRQTVERECDGNIEIPDLHPVPQMLVKDFNTRRFLAEEIDTHINSGQRCQTNRPDTDGSGGIFRPATA
ncbi:hypothetical protein SRABI106_04254 [Rahnella aquatilis]|nr:hypothetical protein SRABI106_04254 [Rahnella aquatilis]